MTKRLEESAERTAASLLEEWIKTVEPGRIERTATEVVRLLDQQANEIPFAAIGLEPVDRSNDHHSTDFDNFYITFVKPLANHLIGHLDLVNAPFSDLRMWSGITWLEGATTERALARDSPLKRTFYERSSAPTSKPFQSADRAVRPFTTWDFDGQDGPEFVDSRNGFTVVYLEDGLDTKDARQRVSRMSPRTADIWRLVTAKAFDHWTESETRPSTFWVDIRDLCNDLGYSKHKKGGHKQSQKAIVARALRDLNALHIKPALNSDIYPKNPATGRRAPEKVVEPEYSKLLDITELDGTMTYEGERLSIRYRINLGEWIVDYPRNQFAPLFKALVKLPGRNVSDLWAKALGTEIVFQYRQHKEESKTLLVRTILGQAGILEQSLAHPEKKLVREYFCHAMDQLETAGICDFWDYQEDDIETVSTSRLSFEKWLGMRVEVIPPPELASVMQGIKRKHFDYREAARRRRRRQSA